MTSLSIQVALSWLESFNGSIQTRPIVQKRPDLPVVDQALRGIISLALVASHEKQAPTNHSSLKEDEMLKYLDRFSLEIYVPLMNNIFDILEDSFPKSRNHVPSKYQFTGSRKNEAKAVPFLVRLLQRVSLRFPALLPFTIDALASLLVCCSTMEVGDAIVDCLQACQGGLDATDPQAIIDGFVAGANKLQRIHPEKATEYFKSRGIEKLEYKTEHHEAIQNFRIKPTKFTSVFEGEEWKTKIARLSDDRTWAEATEEVSTTHVDLIGACIPALSLLTSKDPEVQNPTAILVQQFLTVAYRSRKHFHKSLHTFNAVSFLQDIARMAVDSGALVHLVDELIAPESPFDAEESHITPLTSDKRSKWCGKSSISTAIVNLADSISGNQARLRWWFQEHGLAAKLAKFASRAESQSPELLRNVVSVFTSMELIMDDFVDGPMKDSLDLPHFFYQLLLNAKEGKCSWVAASEVVTPLCYVVSTSTIRTGVAKARAKYVYQRFGNQFLELLLEVVQHGELQQRSRCLESVMSTFSQGHPEAVAFYEDHVPRFDRWFMAKRTPWRFRTAISCFLGSMAASESFMAVLCRNRALVQRVIQDATIQPTSRHVRAGDASAVVTYGKNCMLVAAGLPAQCLRYHSDLIPDLILTLAWIRRNGVEPYITTSLAAIYNLFPLTPADSLKDSTSPPPTPSLAPQPSTPAPVVPATPVALDESELEPKECLYDDLPDEPSPPSSTSASPTSTATASTATSPTTSAPNSANNSPTKTTDSKPGSTAEKQPTLVVNRREVPCEACGNRTTTPVTCKHCTKPAYCSHECFLVSWGEHKFDCSGPVSRRQLPSSVQFTSNTPK